MFLFLDKSIKKIMRIKFRGFIKGKSLLTKNLSLDKHPKLYPFTPSIYLTNMAFFALVQDFLHKHDNKLDTKIFIRINSSRVLLDIPYKEP